MFTIVQIAAGKLKLNIENSMGNDWSRNFSSEAGWFWKLPKMINDKYESKLNWGFSALENKVVNICMS